MTAENATTNTPLTTFKHPGLSKLGQTSIAGWPRKERSAKFFPRYGMTEAAAKTKR